MNGNIVTAGQRLPQRYEGLKPGPLARSQLAFGSPATC